MRTYTREQIEKMGPGEKALALEIDALEAQEELESQQVVDTPSQEAVEPKVEPEVPEVPDSNLHPDDSPKEEARDINYWKKMAKEKEQEAFAKEKEAENWKKRQGDALKTLTPVQQENAALKAKLESLESKLDSVLSNTQPRHTVVDSDRQEYRETYPEISKYTALEVQEATMAVKEAMESRLRESEEKLRDFASIKETVEKHRQEATILQHFNEVKAIHSDAELFFNQVLGPAFTEWASTQSPMVEQIAKAPMSASSKDVAWVISQFKSDTGFNKQSSQPSLGDRVTKVMSAPPAKIEPKDNGLLSDYEMQDRVFDSLLAKSSDNPAEQKRLLDAYERTLTLKLNRN
jgi:hypothetical protein